MDRRKGGRWVLVVIGLLLLWPATAAAQETMALWAMGSVREASSPRRIVLENSGEHARRVEVRVGSAAECAAKWSLGTRELRPGQRWAVTVQDPLCWRRQLTDEEGGGWGGWNTVPLPLDGDRHITL